MVPLHKGGFPFGFSWAFLDNAALFTAGHYHLGDFYRLTLPGNRLYVVTSPEVMQHVLVRQEARYEKSKIYWRELRRVIGDALGSLEGEAWLQLRQVQKPYFTKPAAAGYLPETLRMTQAFMDDFRRQVRQQPRQELVTVLAALNTRITLKAVFGIDPPADGGSLARSISEGEAAIAWRSKYPWRPFTARFNGVNRGIRRNKHVFDTFTAQALRHRAAPPAATVLDALLARPHTQDGIRNELVVHLGASTETTAVATAWTLYLLLRHPEYLHRVRREGRQHLRGRHLQPADLDHLPLLRQVVCESLRLYPPSYAIVRDCIAGDVIGGHRVRRGDTFFISAYGLHRNPRYWHRPDCFLPERFAPENQASIPAHAYIPFGAGKHTCIGKHLALPHVMLTVSLLLEHFELELPGVGEVAAISMSTLKPEGNLALSVKAISS